MVPCDVIADNVYSEISVTIVICDFDPLRSNKDLSFNQNLCSNTFTREPSVLFSVVACTEGRLFVNVQICNTVLKRSVQDILQGSI